MALYLKDPDARLDYAVEWTDWLELHADVVVASTWTATPEGLQLTRPANADGVSTIWAEGGTVGQEYRLTNRITTAAGRVDDRTIRLLITER